MFKVYLSILLFTPSFSYAAAMYDGKPLPQDVNERCRIGVIEMIKMYEENINNTDSERYRANFQPKIIEWNQRLNSDEDVCVIYQDVFNAAFAY